MATLPPLTWIGNAAAVLLGPHGAVTASTQQAGCSRQAAYDQAAKVHQAVADAQFPGPSRHQLLQRNLDLRLQLQQAQDRLDQRSPLDTAALRRCAACASAMGLSLNQTEELLGHLLGPDAPDRSTLGRWVGQAAARASRLLQTLDALARPRVEALCLDEIFCHGRPVLVACEPHSLAVLHCRREPDRSAATWLRTLEPFGALRTAVHDAGSGLCGGVAALNRQRAEQGLQPVQDRLDLFHVEQEAQRLLARIWRGVERCWSAAEQADAARAQAQQRHKANAGHASRCRAAWAKAFRAFGLYEHWEGLWRRARQALELYRPDGRLNDRPWASVELAAVCRGLRAGYWKKLRGYLQDGRLLNFLDGLQADLARAEPDEALRAALAELWRLEHRCAGWPGAAREVLVGLQQVICGKLSAGWAESYRRVALVLGRVVRASSVVECVNSVLRMHQGRHRSLTQALLDLKRLYWNTRAFRTGKRQKRCPYQLLGLELPTFDFWQLLQMDPAQLEQQVSTPKAAA